MSHLFKNSSSKIRGFTPTPISEKIGVSSQGERGFTLIEVLVTMSIMAAILTVILFNQRTYAEAISLNNLADNISITLAQAQAYGIAVREVSPGSADFDKAYGMSFSVLDSSYRNTFIFFVDKDGTEHYTNGWDCPTGATSECLEKVIFSNGNYIYELCRVRTNPNNPYQCNLGRLDISFIRPNVGAQIKFFNSQGNLMDDDSDFIGTRIGIRSSSGFTRSIIVYYTGQISVK